MIVTQIAATTAIVAAVIAIVAAQYTVDHRDREFSWIDYVGMAAVAISAGSLLVSILAYIWGL